MSGGAFNYAYTDINIVIDRITDRVRGDSVYKPLIQHLKILSNVLKDLEWSESGDTCLTQKEVMDKIKSVVTTVDINESIKESLEDFKKDVLMYGLYIKDSNEKKG